MSARKFGTWVDDNGVRHYISGVQITTVLSRRQGEWDTNVFCGGYITAVPDEPHAVVTCFRCLWKAYRPRDPYDILRGQTADLVIVDEVQALGLKTLKQPLDS